MSTALRLVLFQGPILTDSSNPVTMGERREGESQRVYRDTRWGEIEREEDERIG